VVVYFVREMGMYALNIGGKKISGLVRMDTLASIAGTKLDQAGIGVGGVDCYGKEYLLLERVYG